MQVEEFFMPGVTFNIYDQHRAFRNSRMKTIKTKNLKLRPCNLIAECIFFSSTAWIEDDVNGERITKGNFTE